MTNSCTKEIQQAWEDCLPLRFLLAPCQTSAAGVSTCTVGLTPKCRINGCRQGEDDGLVLDGEAELTPVPFADTAFSESACDDTVTLSNHVCRCHDLLRKLCGCNNERNDCDDQGTQSRRVLHIYLIYWGRLWAGR